MTPKDRLFLSPWQKWRKYRKFPWKVVLHCCIVILVSIQVRDLSARLNLVLFNNFPIYVLLTSFECNLEIFFYPFIVSNSRNLHIRPMCSSNKRLYELGNHLQKLLKTKYYYFPYQSVDRYMHVRDKNGSIMPVEMQVQAYTKEFIPENGWNTYDDTTETSSFSLRKIGLSFRNVLFDSRPARTSFQLYA